MTQTRGLGRAALFIGAALLTGSMRLNAQSAPKSAGDYIGKEACMACHPDQGRHFQSTAMGKAFARAKTEKEKLGCEACHGPGRVHAEGGGGKDTIPIRFSKGSKNTVEEKNGACLACHEKGNRLFWEGSPHETRQLACVDCHAAHEPRVIKTTSSSRFSQPLTDMPGTKLPQPELCLQCHQMRRAQLQRSSHMPYREGKVTCTSCHNPHGSPNPKQLIQPTVTSNCLSCHTERKGPFLWEHPPVVENCATCHEPHGTNNPQLLKVRMPRVCDSCHVASRHPVTPTTLNSVRDFNRGCTNCHSKIHGSNHPSGNFFLR